MIKFTVFSGFGDIYWRNPYWKTCFCVVIGVSRYETISLSLDIIKLTFYASRYKRFILSYWCHVFINKWLVICCCSISLWSRWIPVYRILKTINCFRILCLSFVKYIHDLPVVLNFFNFFIPVFNCWVFIFNILFSLIFVSIYFVCAGDPFVIIDIFTCYFGF